MGIRFGVDQLISHPPTWKEKRIAFLTNDAAKTSSQKLSRIALIEAGFHIVTLFSPEHGINTKGADGAKIQNDIDPITSLPIISLYGDKFMPSAEDLNDIDILVFDIPDAGTRFYTYLWSMTYFIEAAAQYDLPIYILDRPNPSGGNFTLSEGPYLDQSVSSFIGRFNIPIKHQCTLGELALYFNDTFQWGANLKVIPCENLTRTHLFTNWHTPWVNPSPALQSFEACILYPGLCFFEATNISVGRSTAYSFEWIGANWFNIKAIKMFAEQLLVDDIEMEDLTLNLPIENTNTTGIRIKVIDPCHFNPVFNGLLILKMIKDIHPEEFKWMPYPTNANPTGNNHLSLLLGIPNAETLFELPLQVWMQQMTKMLSVKDWKSTMEPYLLF